MRKQIIGLRRGKVGPCQAQDTYLGELNIAQRRQVSQPTGIAQAPSIGATRLVKESGGPRLRLPAPVASNQRVTPQGAHPVSPRPAPLHRCWPPVDAYRRGLPLFQRPIQSAVFLLQCHNLIQQPSPFQPFTA